MSIKEIRELSGLTQAQFCDKYGIAQRTLQHWESGDRECPEYVRRLLERVVVEDKGSQ